MSNTAETKKHLTLLEGEVNDSEEKLTVSQIFEILTRKIDEVNEQLVAQQKQKG